VELKSICIFVERKTNKMKNLNIVKKWNSLERYDKLQIIEQGIDFGNTSEGFMQLRLFRDGSISASIQNNLDNHLSSEAVSQDTLISLFGNDYDLCEDDAEVILNWMESQN
jgi:hypothetical protein|tara:strand:+ start:391 stop:723 length:333 start_codon:yes stop_codon:yes gene_type:complete